MAEPIDTGNKTISGRTIWNDPETGEDYSERSTTFEIEGKHYTMPTVSEDGRQHTDDQIRDYVKEYGPIDYLTGEKLPEFRYREDAIQYAISRSSTRKPKMAEGGDVAAQTEEALGWTAEGNKFAEANPVNIKAPEALSIKDVPSFDRPMSAGPKDKWTGRQDELGNREYKSQLDGSTYFIKPDPDQRTELEKIQQDIIPAVTKYLENPTAPSKEQTIEFLKSAAGDAWETISIPGDLVSGDKTLGDVNLGQLFEIGGGMAGASTLGKVPGGNSSNTLRMFGGVGMEGTGTSKSFKKAKNLLKKYNKDQLETSGGFINSDAEGKIGGIGFNENKKIWEETNWYVDPNDGQWRFYIDDSKSTLNPYEKVLKIPKETGVTFKQLGDFPKKRGEGAFVNLFDILNHEDLYEKYPDLKGIKVEFYSDPTNPNRKGSARGAASGEVRSIKDSSVSINMAAYDNWDEVRSTLLHEIQHVVQDFEEFVPGSNKLKIPGELLELKAKELKTKIKPIETLRDSLKNDLNSIKRTLDRRLEELKTPIKGLTREQELEIFKLKTQVPDISDMTGPSWASIGRDYGVSSAQVQKAWGRQNSLDYLTKEKARLNKEILKAGNEMLAIDKENLNLEYEFYRGAGGEIESRLVQYMADGTKKFPVEARARMLQQEGSNFQYRGKDGVDPYEYKNHPRREPDKVSFLDRLKGSINKQKFAQGGVVEDMNRQMEMFAVGGLSDDGMTRDPVSGNDIPPGSMAEEVRDDIPAQLSEGEYVVPADVVRFFGVKYFEDLRTEAKMGLSNMEANGRIGGEPVPSGGPMAGPTESALTPEEMAALAEMGMNVGGFVPQQQPPVQAIGNTQQGMDRGYAPGGQVVPMAGPTGNPSTTGGGLTKADITTPAFDQQKLQQDFGLGYSLFGPTTPTGEVTSMVTLYGPDKQIITLTLPAQQTEYDRLIKEGYTTKQAGETVTTETSVGKDEGHSIEKSDMGEGGKRFSEMDATEIQQAYNNNLKASTVLAGMASINPAFALIGQATTNFANKKIVERMEALKIDPPEDEGYFKNIVTGAKSLVNDLFGRDKDPKKSAVSASNTKYQTDDAFVAPTPTLGNDDPDPFETTDTASQIVGGEGVKVTAPVVKPKARPKDLSRTEEEDTEITGAEPDYNKGGFVSKRTKKKKK